MKNKWPIFSEKHTVDLFNTFLQKMQLPEFKIENGDIVKSYQDYCNKTELENKARLKFNMFGDDLIERQSFFYPYVMMIHHINIKQGKYTRFNHETK